MKRPSTILRFRNQEQLEQIRASAASRDLSVNEYILLAIEYAEEVQKEIEEKQ